MKKKSSDSPTASETAALREILERMLDRGLVPTVIKSHVAAVLRAGAKKPMPRRGDIWRNQSVAKGDLEIITVHKAAAGESFVVVRNTETDRVTSSRLDVFLRLHAMVKRRPAFDGGDDVVAEVSIAEDDNVRRLPARIRQPEGA
jgi:hypothetical protein